jgi:hypothetical protein
MKTKLLVQRLREASPLIGCLAAASTKSWHRTITWFGFNLLGGLMPLWGTLLLWELHSQGFTFYDFVKHGEFALYAAAFLAPSLQQIASNIKDTKYVLGAGTVLVAVTGLVIAVLIYSGAQPPQHVDPTMLTRWSLILLPASILFSVFVTLIQHQMRDPDLGAAENEAVANLSSRLKGKLPPPTEPAVKTDLGHGEQTVPSEQELKAAFQKSTHGDAGEGSADNA